MKFKAKNDKLSIRTWLLIAVGLIIYFLVGGYAFNLFPKEINPIYIGVGILVGTAFIIYYLKNYDK